jgi:hypothetical protein
MSRTRLGLSAVLITAALTQPATADESRTYWHAQTKGAPATTLTGQWVSVDRDAVLTLGGGHESGRRTTMVAGWVTPKLTGREFMLDTEWEWEFVNEFGQKIPFTHRYRFKVDGGDWSSWREASRRIRPRSGLGGGGFRMIAFSDRKIDFQLEWQMLADIRARAAMSARYFLHVEVTKE